MEKIQERALRFVYRDYDTTYHDLLHKAILPTLKLVRERTIAILTYKILHDQAPNYLKDLINCDRNSKLYLPSYKSTKHGINYFTYRTKRICNSLQERTRNAPYLPSFKSRIKGWNGLPRNRCIVARGTSRTSLWISVIILYIYMLW